MADRGQQRVVVVTDSTADLPPELVAQYDIRVVPQILIFGQQFWRDGIDIDPPAFYELLQSRSGFPSTSQPSINEFHTLFTRLAREADGIVAVLVSSELSGTVNSALGAQQSLLDLPIEIIDSRGVSLMLGFAVLAAAREAAAGGDLEAVAAAARRVAERAHVVFVVDTLEFLHRGGRIGTAARLLGTALSLKPVLEIRDGMVQPVAQIRTRRKALQKLFELVEEGVAGSDRIHLAVLHIAAPEEAARLVEQVATRFQPVEMFQSECGPVVGAHAGPGTVALAFYVE
jgi:DegV family protein with EDD domain